MKILIIGSEGFIGNFLSRKLRDKGYEVIGMDKHSDKKQMPYRFVNGDILNPEDILFAAKDADAIIHLAAAHHDFGITEEEFFDVNVKGTQNILDCAHKLGIKKYIFYSSVAVYGNSTDCADENTASNPVNTYGKSKLEAENLIHKWAKENPKREAMILRPCVIFGPNNFANTYKLINSIYRKRFFFVGKGDNIKSVAYIENLVDATIFLLERLKPGIDVYNYSDYPQMTISQTVKTISKHLSCDIPKFRVPLTPAIMLTSIFDLLGKILSVNFPITAFRIKKFNMSTQFGSEKIRSAGFKQKISLSEGFRRMIEWYLNSQTSKIKRVIYRRTVYEQKA